MTTLGWVAIARIETVRGSIEMLQHDETGRVKMISTIYLYFEKVLKKNPDSILRPDQQSAKCFKFFDSLEEMIRWVEKEGLLSQLDFNYAIEPQAAEFVV